MAAKKYLALISGFITQAASVVTSSGAANDGDLVALDATGRLDPTVMPVGVVPDATSKLASENLSAGNYINFWLDSGTIKVRLADNSNARAAHGFVKASVTSGQSATVYFEGPNANLSSLTGASRYYLGTAGAVTATPLDPTSGANTGKIHQFLGVAIETTSINTDIEDPVVL